MPLGMNFLESMSATVLAMPGTVAYLKLFLQVSNFYCLKITVEPKWSQTGCKNDANCQNGSR